MNMMMLRNINHINCFIFVINPNDYPIQPNNNLKAIDYLSTFEFEKYDNIRIDIITQSLSIIALGVIDLTKIKCNNLIIGIGDQIKIEDVKHVAKHITFKWIDIKNPPNMILEKYPELEVFRSEDKFNFDYHCSKFGTIKPKIYYKIIRGGVEILMIYTKDKIILDVMSYTEFEFLMRNDNYKLYDIKIVIENIPVHYIDLTELGVVPYMNLKIYFTKEIGLLPKIYTNPGNKDNIYVQVTNSCSNGNWNLGRIGWNTFGGSCSSEMLSS